MVINEEKTMICRDLAVNVIKKAVRIMESPKDREQIRTFLKELELKLQMVNSSIINRARLLIEKTGMTERAIDPEKMFAFILNNMLCPK